MSESSVNTRIEFVLNGQNINAPAEWTDIEVSASFDEENEDANISFDSFRFVNTDKEKSSKVLRDWITTDSPGIFHGIPFLIRGFNDRNQLVTFDGYVNLSNDVSILEDGSTVAKIIEKTGLDSFNDRIEALTWGYLEEIGAVSQSDYTEIDYVVEKKFNFFEILMSNIVLFLLIKELIESIKDLSKQINDLFGHSAGGISGPTVGPVWLVAAILIQTIYTTLIAIAVINLGNQLLETLLPRVRQSKTIKMRTAMEIVATHLGLNLVSPIDELDDIYFLPSNPRQDDVSFLSGLITNLKGTPTGIPNVVDFGYNCLDFFQTISDLVYGKFAIVGNTLQFRTHSDPYWLRNANYVMPDVLVEEQKFNTEDLKARWALLFAIDQSDEWTIDNYQGTSYEVVTDAISTPIVDAKFLKGLDENNLFVSLGNRKDQLNGIENLLNDVAQFLDSVVNTLGGNSNLAGGIQNKIGVLKVSTNNYSKPKYLYLKNAKLPVNHRDLFNARLMWEKYHVEKSFVQNNYGAQKKLYKGVKIPFGLESFVLLSENSYFTDNEGRLGRVTSINWNLFGDFATVDYWIREPYTRNLQETFIEAS